MDITTFVGTRALPLTVFSVLGVVLIIWIVEARSRLSEDLLRKILAWLAATVFFMILLTVINIGILNVVIDQLNADPGVYLEFKLMPILIGMMFACGFIAVFYVVKFGKPSASNNVSPAFFLPVPVSVSVFHPLVDADLM